MAEYINGLRVVEGSIVKDDIYLQNTTMIATLNQGAGNYQFKAYDTNAFVYKTVAWVVSAADPYMSFCGSEQFKFYNSGYVLGSGPILTTSYIELTEMSAPGAGSANTVRIYALEGAGDAFTDLCAVFQDSTVDVFAQETTPETSPIFELSSGTVGKIVMIKPHPGLIKFCMVFPDGREFVLRQIEYHDRDKIAANKGTLSSKLPKGWIVETAAQRLARVSKEPM